MHRVCEACPVVVSIRQAYKKKGLSLTGFVDQSCFVCMFKGFSEYEVTFASIFTGFAESRLWECRVFSFKIACTSQKSRVFPGKGTPRVFFVL